MVFLLSVFILSHFNIIIKFKSETTKQQFNIIVLSDFLLATYFSVSMLYSSARFNTFSDEHIHHLIKISEILQEINTFQEHFFDLDPTTYSIIHVQKSMIFKQKLDNPVFEAFVTTIKKICPKKDISGYLENLLETYMDVIETLKNEREFD